MPKHIFCQATPPLVILFAVAFAVSGACATIAIESGSMRFEGQHVQSGARLPDVESTWRYTKFGWQDSARWPVADSFSPIQTMELLHPVVWSGCVLIAVIAMMIWASSEWEISRLFNFNRDEDSDAKSQCGIQSEKAELSS